MPLFKLNEDYKGWKAGVTIRLCSQDHIDAMGRGIGVEAEEPKPKAVKTQKVSPNIVESMPKAEPTNITVNKVIPEVSKEKPKPILTKEPPPATPRTFNTRSQKKKGSGKKRK